MACHCFEWATGAPRCIGIIAPSGVQSGISDCRAACRQAGMAALCYSSIGSCYSDDCSGGDFLWGRWLTMKVSWECWPSGRTKSALVTGFSISLAGKCSNTRPVDDSMLGTSWTARVSEPSGLCDSEVLLTGELRIEVVGLGEWEQVCAVVGAFISSPCSRVPLDPTVGHTFVKCSRIPMKVPCCFGPNAPIPCKFITPLECVRQCGQPYEGTVYATSPDPCTIATTNNPCRRGPCCKGPYPQGFPQSTNQFPLGMGAPETYTEITDTGGFILRCDIRSSSDCVSQGGTPASSTRSCFEPSQLACYGGNDPSHSKCVYGKWELAYRPDEHKPPHQKQWLEGSTEIVSEKPEKVDTFNSGGECAYHYGDVAYRNLGGDAYGTICTRLPAQRTTENPCPDYFARTYCPLAYGVDGNARFECGYRIATN